ncbi:16S rRNA (guanine(966)-N(2))-methyltransferase RsmD [Spiroplasma endosymbiont of Aspidapion aeneum]|uniref:16S rRNA (guanine(966)-N(2))-methyltransferase RsmD n=1 Tax=Spiroplasma endosymbiont of Aspidapion aeneum TaxID=3066276 RepID=UPI00313B1542
MCYNYINKKGNMRIISGKHRGKLLHTLEGKSTRPTSSRVKEDMFNILNNYIIFKGKVSLDLFAGSGALSIEGISRGIKKAYINDISPQAIEVIKKNLSMLKEDIYQIMMYDWNICFNYIKEKVDVIYFDPPFAEHNYYYQFLEFIDSHDVLNKYGLVSIQSEFDLPIESVSLEILRKKVYKNKYYYLLRKV